MNVLNKTLQWLSAHKKTSVLLYVLSVFIFFEFCLKLVASYGLVRIVHYPTTSAKERFLGDINPRFGIWHYPNRTVNHVSPCFDVTYTSNEHGARDRSRSFESVIDTRVAVLGDSFVEGYGVNAQDRMTDIAERETGREFMNFGVSGNFGTIQSWLLYEDLVSKFEHAQVVVSLLPANDFEDNNPAFFDRERYRPYLRKAGSKSYEVFYTVNFSEKQNPLELSPFRRFRKNLYNTLYTANLIRQVGDFIEGSEIAAEYKEIRHSMSESSYDNFTSADMEIMKYSLGKLIEKASPRPVTLMVIPRHVDFEWHDNNGYHFKLLQHLKTLAQTYRNVGILDLLPQMDSYADKRGISSDDLFHKCDGHWSKLGNEVAADILVEFLKLKDNPYGKNVT